MASRRVVGKEGVVVIKVERPACIKKMSDKQVSNALTTKLRTAPNHTKEFYHGDFEKLKTGKSFEKIEFIEQVLTSATWGTGFFFGN